jgi:aminoglycoside phosphotransferase (APT) family kinase protein
VKGETVKNLRVSNFEKINNSWNNDVFSFSLTYTDEIIEQRHNLILKAYSDKVYPDLAMKHRDGEDIRKCCDESEVLKSLGRLDFSVPKVFLSECNPNFLGFPFVIMFREEVKQESNHSLDCFAQTLAKLHNFRLDELKIKAIEPPKNNVAFAKRWSIHFKDLLEKTKPTKRLREDIDFAIKWLDSNVSDNYCPQYCLVHGDFTPDNVFLNGYSRFIVLDWEWAEIGDPAYDVGYAYHFVRLLHDPESPESEEKADRFISEYTRNFRGDIRQRLEFYQVVGILRLAILFNSVLTNPLRAYKFHGSKALIAFPFIRRPFIAKKIGTYEELFWLNYSKNFLESTLKR